MRIRHSGKSVFIPEPTALWTFKQPSSPVYDVRGRADLTVGGGVFNGNSLRIDQSNAANYFESPVGSYDKNDTFTVFLAFRPDGVVTDSDIICMASGTGGAVNDYSWYFDTNASGTGFLLGVATEFTYGTQLGLSYSSVDTTKKHYALFGYRKSPSANYAFLHLFRDGDSAVMSARSNAMADLKLSQGHSFHSRGDTAGTAVPATYYRMAYWENTYLDSIAVFGQLIQSSQV